MAIVAPWELVVADGAGSAKLSEKRSATCAAAEHAHLTPSPVHEAEHILDYYESEDANHTYTSSSLRSSYQSDNLPAQRAEQETPAIASAWSPMHSAGKEANGYAGRTSMDSVASSSGSVRRRTSQRSAGAADKRRLAVMEVGDGQESRMSISREQRNETWNIQSTTDHNLFARRGVDSSRLAGLALVAPPDAQFLDYTGLSPVPSSAPPTGALPRSSRLNKTENPPAASSHHRSMSDAQSRRKGGSKTSPRDVGIVGTLSTILPPSLEDTGSTRPEHRRLSTDVERSSDIVQSDALTAPVFQTPRSRSSSPLPNIQTDIPAQSSTLLSAQEHSVLQSSPLTPDIGQEKDIGRPVAGPVVVKLSSGQMMRRSPNTTLVGLPTTEPPKNASYDRDTQRTSGRLPFKPNQTASLSYLHYQPGVHSTAGPLPSPPRHILTPFTTQPPPRPPRMLSPPPERRHAINQTKASAKVAQSDTSNVTPVTITSLKPPLPISRAGSEYSISAMSVSSSGSDEKPSMVSSRSKLESEAALMSVSDNDGQDKPRTSSRTSAHVREGAFPTSSIFLSNPSQSPLPHSHPHIIDEVVASANEVPELGEFSSPSSPSTSTAVEAPILRHSQGRHDLKRENSWTSLSAPSFVGGPDDISPPSPPSSYASSNEENSTGVGTTTVTSDGDILNRRRASLPVTPLESHRRFHSLPRTPSVASHTRSRSPSPFSPPQLILPKKPPSSWPNAMNFHDILLKKTAAERALAYATRLRELSMEETGLKEWLGINVARKERRDHPPSMLPQLVVPSRGFVKQPRHLSRNSMASELTFPMRQDSYIATDLTVRPTTDLSSPISQPLALPYPSLAHGVGIRKRSSRTFTTDSSLASPSSSTRSLGTAFFASIGRKASIRKDRTLPSTSPTKLTSMRMSSKPLHTRPIKIDTPPTLPGGPRAPPRSARTNSVIFHSPSLEQSRAEAGILSMSSSRPSIESTASFERQIEKLSDLLPHADKDILAGYLRRASNQDPMLAIGTYLDDEKQGCLRRD